MVPICEESNGYLWVVSQDPAPRVRARSLSLSPELEVNALKLTKIGAKDLNPNSGILDSEPIFIQSVNQFDQITYREFNQVAAERAGSSKVALKGAPFTRIHIHDREFERDRDCRVSYRGW